MWPKLLFDLLPHFARLVPVANKYLSSGTDDTARETALAKLELLRGRVRRSKSLGKSLDKLKSPTLEKALVFLDDKLLGATRNAVERANRRFRKAQKSIYSVRTKEHLEQRLALDMYREQRTPKRRQTVKTLHVARSKPDSLH